MVALRKVEAWEKKAAPNLSGTTRAHPTLTSTGEEGVTAPQGQEKGKGLCVTWGFPVKGFCSGGGRWEQRSSRG